MKEDDKEKNFNDLMNLAFARIEKNRAGKIYEGDTRHGCLLEETICEYLELLLSDAELDKVEKHLFQCLFLP